MRATGRAANPEIERTVNRLIAEDTQYDRIENRSSLRHKFIRAVDLQLRDSGREIPAFSRNLSADGIGVITNEMVAEGEMAVISIAPLGQGEVLLLGKCRWCKSYGENWFLSGWQFINLKR